MPDVVGYTEKAEEQTAWTRAIRHDNFTLGAPDVAFVISVGWNEPHDLLQQRGAVSPVAYCAVTASPGGVKPGVRHTEK